MVNDCSGETSGRENKRETVCIRWCLEYISLKYNQQNLKYQSHSKQQVDGLLLKNKQYQYAHYETNISEEICVRQQQILWISTNNVQTV